MLEIHYAWERAQDCFNDRQLLENVLKYYATKGISPKLLYRYYDSRNRLANR
jgi:hypothetical protein